MKKLKFICVAVLCVIVMAVFSVQTYAADVVYDEERTQDIIDEYSQMLSGLPSDVADMLPEGFFSKDVGEMSDAVGEASGFSYIVGKLFEVIGLNLRSSVALLALMCGLLILSSVFGCTGDALGGTSSATKASSLCSSLVVLASIFTSGFDMLTGVMNYLTQLNVITGSMIPIMAVMYSMGGNVGAAVANTSTVTVFLALSEFICNSTLVPWFCMCMGVSTVSAIAPSVNLRSIGNAIKRIYTVSLGFIMLILTATLSTQTVLSSASSSLAYKSAKYAAGTFIPVVGSTVGETLGTLAKSLSYLKSTLGVGGIVIIFLIVLPVIVSIAMRRIVYMLAASVGEMLGCDRESKLLSDITGLYGYLLGVVCICSVVVILIFTVFVKCSVAWST